MSLEEAFVSLPLGERVKRYRTFAEQTFERAMATQDEDTRAALINVSLNWALLAHETEGVEALLLGDNSRLIELVPANEWN